MLLCTGHVTQADFKRLLQAPCKLQSYRWHLGCLEWLFARNWAVERRVTGMGTTSQLCDAITVDTVGEVVQGLSCKIVAGVYAGKEV